MNQGLSPLKNLRVWSKLTEKQVCENSKEPPLMVSEVFPKGRVGSCIEGTGQWVGYVGELVLEMIVFFQLY